MSYGLKRILQLVPVLLGITFLSFALMYLAGGDAVTYLYDNAGVNVSQEVIDAARAQKGLDQPFLVQYLHWMKNLFQGDMGVSYITGRDVLQTFLEKLPATLLLTVASVAVTMMIALPLGVLCAMKQNQAMDKLLRLASFLGNSLPNFFVAVVLIYFFCNRLGWFPVIANQNRLQSLVLPVLTLAIPMSSKYMRQIRATVLEELKKDYVTGALARGVKQGVVIWSNVLKTSMMTIVTLLSLSIGNLLGGTAIVETIFMWDGVGKMAVDAITMRDYPIIQAYVMWMAIIYVVCNFVADYLYQWLDPRVRLERENSTAVLKSGVTESVLK